MQFSWLTSLVERRRQKTLSNRELYAALIRKGAISGELDADDLRKLANVADALNISASELQDDAAAIAEFEKCQTDLEATPAAELELRQADAEIIEHNAECEKTREQWHRKATAMEARIRIARQRLSTLGDLARRAQIIRDEHPSLFAQAAAVAE